MSAAPKPNTPEWLEARKGGVGSSDAPGILGVSPYTHARKVYATKQADYTPDTETQAMHRGHVLEEPIAMAISRRMEITCEPSVFVQHPDYDFILDTPDRLVGDDVVMEIKTHDAWVADDYGPSGTDGYPVHEYVQCAHHMAVTGRSKCLLVVLLAEGPVMDLMVKLIDEGQVSEDIISRYIEQMDLRVYEIDRDPDFESDLLAAEIQFWHEYVEAGVEPPELEKVRPDKASLRKATAKEAKEIAIAKKHWLALERAQTRLDKKKNVLQQMVGMDYGLVDPETQDKVSWGKNKDTDKAIVKWQDVAMAIGAEADFPSERFEEIVEANTMNISKEGARVWRWPTRKWKKEL